MFQCYCLSSLPQHNKIQKLVNYFVFQWQQLYAAYFYLVKKMLFFKIYGIDNEVGIQFIRSRLHLLFK